MRLSTALVSASLLALVACGGGGSARIQNKGSDSLLSVANAWAEAYQKVQPAVQVAVNGGGSGTGISAMINGTVDIANASRKMKDSEIEAARKNGIDPVEHVVGFDALAVFVHKDNPIQSLTIEQLAGIYGEGGTITKWSQLGVQVPGAGDEIVVVSRQNNSGTYAYFQEAVLGEGGKFKLGTRDLQGSKEVVELCADTPAAIGYSGMAYATEHARMVPIVKGGAAPVAPSTKSAVDGTYPIARPLFMYTKKDARPEVTAYLDWILSDAGQRIILAEGYAPVRSLE